MSGFERIVILTGAGISAESGLGTFRGEDGLWTKHKIEDVATPEGFARNPELVHDFYNGRRVNLLRAEPNAAHHALARLEQEHQARVWVVTQNIDNLHERAGSANVLHMHGEMLKARCARCGNITAHDGDLSLDHECPGCGRAGGMRPDVVWFGEMPHHLARIDELLARCDLFISLGTSGTVYPAAGFVSQIRHLGRAHTVELNLEPSDGHSLFAEQIYGPATEVAPAYVETLLAGN